MVDLSIAMLNYQRVVATVPDLSISVSRFGRSPEQWVFRGFQTCQFCPRVNGSKMPLWMDPFQFKTLIISNDGGSGRCAACFHLSHLQLPLQKVYPRHGYVNCRHFSTPTSVKSTPDMAMSYHVCHTKPASGRSKALRSAQPKTQ
jgi:hypothetical protein